MVVVDEKTNANDRSVISEHLIVDDNQSIIAYIVSKTHELSLTLGRNLLSSQPEEANVFCVLLHSSNRNIEF